MANSLPLHVLFTMNCQPADRKLPGPKSWELSARSIDTFCNRLLRAGYPPSLLVSPWCAEEQAPLLQDLSAVGVELGLYVYPKALDNKKYKHYLGAYNRDEQYDIIRLALDRFEDALEMRPTSFRSGEFSASDDTFEVLSALGFRQGSVSSPGRRVTKYNADWTGAAPDPHYADGSNKLRPGKLPFLEIPVTTDAESKIGGVAADLCIETSKFDEWHLPIAESQIRRTETQTVGFRTLCIFTHNSFAYHKTDETASKTLDSMVEYIDSLSDTHEIVPVTMSRAHSLFRASNQQPTRVVGD